MTAPDVIDTLLYISDAKKRFNIKVACFATMTFTIHETLFTLDDESSWIWSLPKRSVTRWLYMFSKYFAVFVQISNLVATFNFHARYPIIDDQTCRMWFLFRIMAVQLMSMSFELILTVRVYALYLHSHQIALLMILIFFCKFVVMCNAIKLLYEGLEFSHTCLITKAPPIVAYFGTGGMFTQFVILGLTFFQYAFAVREGWRQAPVMSIMFRDGSVVFIIISTVLVVTMIHEFFRGVVASIAFSGFISITSSAGCRLIINMRKVICGPESGGQDSEISGRFSSVIDISSAESGRGVEYPVKYFPSEITAGNS